METNFESNLERDSRQKNIEQFYSAEILLNELNMLYQFKIWNNPANSMFFIIKENSAIRSCLNVGDILKMKYYSTDAHCPTENLNTKIKSITMENDGRFKGHYIVGLEITHDEARQLSH